MRFTVKEVITIIDSLTMRRHRITNFGSFESEDAKFIDSIVNKLQKQVVGEVKIKKVKVYENGTKQR